MVPAQNSRERIASSRGVHQARQIHVRYHGGACTAACLVLAALGIAACLIVAMLGIAAPVVAQENAKPLQIGVLALGPRNIPAWRCASDGPHQGPAEPQRETIP